MNGKKITLLVFTIILAVGTVFGGGRQSSSQAAPSGTSPRNQTLYMNLQNDGTITGYNPYGNCNNNFSKDESQLVFETLFLFNMLDKKLYPQIGDSYSWDGQTMTIQLNQNVKFWDGTALTAQDVVNSYELQKNYVTPFSGYWSYLDSVTAQGDYTVILKGKSSNFNPKYMEASITALYITSKAYWEKQKLGSGQEALLQFAGFDCMGTGPYKPHFHEETSYGVMRDDNYWGKHPSRNGKLPVPKYIVQASFRGDNASVDIAFEAGQIDVSGSFHTEVWKLWERGLPVETYIPQAPYYMPGVIPMIIYNTTKPGLNDPAVRRAIAMVLDYDRIAINAMSGYSAKMVPSLMLPVPAEQNLIDLNAIRPYQWSGIDVAGANKLLDDAGWVRGTDGIRAKGGVKLVFKAECPFGWTDWNAALEVVAQSTKQIGLDIQTYYPDTQVVVQDRMNGTFDIVMYSPFKSDAASPWSRAYEFMGSMNLPPVGTSNVIQNYGRWVNQEANQIINQLASEANEAKLKELWTRLNIIFLQEMPAAPLMYRPALFCTWNTTVWTGFPRLNDGTNIPPTLCNIGYGVKALYNLRLK